MSAQIHVLRAEREARTNRMRPEDWPPRRDDEQSKRDHVRRMMAWLSRQETALPIDAAATDAIE